jgi:hypothetical protein
LIPQGYPLYAQIKSDGTDNWLALVVGWDGALPVVIPIDTWEYEGARTVYGTEEWLLTVERPAPPTVPGADPTLPAIP